MSFYLLYLQLFIVRVNRELQRVYRNGCRYNERLNAETGGSQTSHIHWVVWVNIYECRCEERLKTKSEMGLRKVPFSDVYFQQNKKRAKAKGKKKCRTKTMRGRKNRYN
jgi:hypothetical protein